MTSEAKLTNDGRAMGIVAADYNGDGAIDLFVANDAMANYLYTSNGDGTFSDVALESGTAYSQSGNATSSMCGAVGDYDNDGDFDVLVPDMGYNSLNDNGGRLFQDVSFQTNLAAISGQYVSWGGGLIDYDLDGWLDIVLANGDAHRLAGQEDVLLRNVPGDDGRRRFADVWESAGRYFKTKHVGRGMAVGDIDNDGDLDVTIVNLDGAVALLRNDRSPDDGRHWLTVSLRGTRSNREGVGAVVSVRCGEDTFVRQRTVGGTYISSNDRRLHFGLGKSARVDELVVRWPSGLVQSVGPMEADRIIEIVEPTSE